MNLEMRKKTVERMKVECAKADMQLRIYESEENIQRLKENIKIQDDKLVELDKELNK